MTDKQDIFNLIIGRADELHRETGRPTYQTFVQWFIELFFLNPKDVYYSDGSYDGKTDAFLKVDNDKVVQHHVINSKFTKEFNKQAPPTFYEEIAQFSNIFRNKLLRSEYLEKAVKPEVAKRLSKALEAYDDGRTTLHFLTNFRRNEKYVSTIRHLDVEVYHLEDLIQFLADDLDGAMPRTADLVLTDINTVLTPDIRDTEISTSIVFGKLKDFIEYMKDDPNDLLFARNIRLDLKNTEVNKSIKETFRTHAHEFAYCNNGITMLCDKSNHETGKRILVIRNPRVVNGSQTLHSIRSVLNPSPLSSSARVMIRIIEVPPFTPDELPKETRKKKEIINKISTRTNQQNPIKRWNLVSNDEFQLDLFRYFRRKKLFYERREKEWKTRSRELKSIGFRQGPNIKHLMQLITCYLWNEKQMGPFVARTVGDIFEPPVYDSLTRITPEIAYQLYLLSNMISDSFRFLRKKKGQKYLHALKGYLDLPIFAVIVQILSESDASWGEQSLTSILETQFSDFDTFGKTWDALTLKSIQHINTLFQKKSKDYKKKEGKDLTIANYVKNTGNSMQLYASLIPQGSLSIGKKILRGN